ncbi:acylphosphatase-2-like [Babylonia areolata]|uniref:acylphosphatase-2-like n=1 Tax=Babylonia areolata TaxID=304850 RepID=UPI003FD00D64
MGVCCPSTMAAAKLMTVDFEVFGKVQGVFFRKYTQNQAKMLGLSGWVMNTKDKTVVGTIQGPAEKVSTMKTWLEKKGSPKSRIDKCTFKEVVKAQTFHSFDIRK